MLSENLVVDVESVRLCRLGRMEVGAVLVDSRVVTRLFLGPEFCEQMKEEDEIMRRVEDCASDRWRESM
jgi:hypothetical protein